MEDAKPDVPDTEDAKPDVPDTEDAKPDVPDTEDAKPDVPDTEDAKPDVPNTEDAKPDVPNTEDAEPDVPNTEDAEPDVPNTEDAEPDVPNTEDAEPDVPNTEDAEPDVPNTEDAKPDVPNTEDVKPDVPNTEDVVKPQEENELLDTFVHQAILKDPFLSFSRTGDDSRQWIELLQALEKQDIPGWPLLTPMKVQTRKCEKCSREYCSEINYRRHTRVQHRAKKLDKDTKKERELLGVFWDRLPLKETMKITSFKDVTLEDIPGSSVVKALETLVRKPGFFVLPQAYIKAGTALLDIITAKQPRLPAITSQELFNILDNASERTFLWEKAESMEKYLFDGEARKNGLEAKNVVSCTSYLLETQLVKAWTDENAAAAQRFENLLMEEEAEYGRRASEKQEKKRQKKQRQKAKGQKKADDTNANKIDSPLADVKETGDDILEDPADTCSSLPASGDDPQNQEMLLTEASSSLEQFDPFENQWQTMTRKKAKGQRRGETQRPAVTGSPSPASSPAAPLQVSSKQGGRSGSNPNQWETQRPAVTGSPSPASSPAAPLQVSSKQGGRSGSNPNQWETQRPAVTGSPSPASSPAAPLQVSSKQGGRSGSNPNQWETQHPAVTGSPSPASSPAVSSGSKQVGSPGGRKSRNRRRRAKNDNKVASPKINVGNDGESPKTSTSQDVATSQPDETKSIAEFPIGSVPVSQDVATSQPDETKSIAEFPIGSVPVSQDVATSQPDETKSVVEFPIGSVPASQDVATSQPDETKSIAEFPIGSVPASQDVATSEPDETKSVVEFPIGSVPASQDVATSQPDETKSVVEFPIGSVPASQDVATSQPDETKSISKFLIGSISVSVDNSSANEETNLTDTRNTVEVIKSRILLWRPDTGYENGFRDFQVEVFPELSVDGRSNVPSYPTDKGKSSTDNTLSLLRKSICHGQSNFNYDLAKVMLEQRYNEAISAEHVELFMLSGNDPQESSTPPTRRQST